MSVQQNPSKRPRLSLQIKTIANGPNLRGSRTVAAAVNPTSPTAFNTLSNVYVTAIDRATPVTATNKNNFLCLPPSRNQFLPLKIQTQDLVNKEHDASHTQHYTSTHLDTPVTAQPPSPGPAPPPLQISSAMTATPPMSSGPVDETSPRSFSFSVEDTAAVSAVAAAEPAESAETSWQPSFLPSSDSTATAKGTTLTRRRATMPLTLSSSPSRSALPYTRNRSLHSILRNSPLPPPTARTPLSPRLQSLRTAEKASRRVGYGSPIEQEITTNEYVRSHIDLLADELSPRSTSSSAGDEFTTASPTDDMAFDLPTAACGGCNVQQPRDGGQTPGPLEEVRRRMVGFGPRTPTSPPLSSTGGSPSGTRKRKRKETKRRWVWTIGTPEDDADDREVGGAIAALRAAARAQAQSQGLAQHQLCPNNNAPAASAGANYVAADCQTPRILPEPRAGLSLKIPFASLMESPLDDTAQDVIMSQAETALDNDQSSGSSRSVSVDSEADPDQATPAVAFQNNITSHNAYLTSAMHDSDSLFHSETGSRPETAIPPDMISHMTRTDQPTLVGGC